MENETLHHRADGKGKGMNKPVKPKVGSFQAMGLAHDLFRGVSTAAVVEYCCCVSLLSVVNGIDLLLPVLFHDLCSAFVVFIIPYPVMKAYTLPNIATYPLCRAKAAFHL